MLRASFLALFALCIGVTFSTHSMSARGADEPVDTPKLPPPGPLDEEVGIKALRDALGADIAKAATASQKTALSSRLLIVAVQSKDQPLTRWGAFRESIRLANEAADPAASIAAIDAQAKYFTIDVPKQKLRAFRESVDGPPAPPPASLSAIALAAIATIPEAEQVDDYDAAVAMAEIAHEAAVKGKDVKIRETAEKTRATIKIVAKEFETAGKAIAANPEDPEANLAWGRFWALGRWDWPKGLPFLAKASGDVAILAKEDLLNPTDPAVQTTLADRWWESAEKEKEERFVAAMKARGAWWYQKALPSLDGAKKATAEKRIAAAPRD